MAALNTDWLTYLNAKRIWIFPVRHKYFHSLHPRRNCRFQHLWWFRNGMVIDVSTSSLIVLQLSKLFSSVNQSHIRQATTDFYNETFFHISYGYLHYCHQNENNAVYSQGWENVWWDKWIGGNVWHSFEINQFVHMLGHKRCSGDVKDSWYVAYVILQGLQNKTENML